MVEPTTEGSLRKPERHSPLLSTTRRVPIDEPRRVPTSSRRSKPGPRNEAGSKRVKVVARDPQHAEPLSPPVPDEVAPGFAVVGERRDGFEGCRVIAKGREVRAREVVSRGGLVGLLLVEAHELARLLVRQRGEQHRLKDAEYRRRAADPQGERGDHNGREAGTPPQLSNRVPEILFHRAPMLPRGVKQQISEHLEPQA